MSTRIVELHPSAVDDARAARVWYAARSELAEAAFMAELDAAISRIAAAPLCYPNHIQGTRRYLFKRFPFAVVFRVTNEAVTVIAIAHARRSPGYWSAR